jgi:hypothetical protein
MTRDASANRSTSNSRKPFDRCGQATAPPQSLDRLPRNRRPASVADGTRPPKGIFLSDYAKKQQSSCLARNGLVDRLYQQRSGQIFVYGFDYLAREERDSCAPQFPRTGEVRMAGIAISRLVRCLDVYVYDLASFAGAIGFARDVPNSTGSAHGRRALLLVGNRSRRGDP